MGRNISDKEVEELLGYGPFSDELKNTRSAREVILLAHLYCEYCMNNLIEILPYIVSLGQVVERPPNGYHYNELVGTGTEERPYGISFAPKLHILGIFFDLNGKYLFCWNDVPGKDESKVKDYLKFLGDGLADATIKKEVNSIIIANKMDTIATFTLDGKEVTLEYSNVKTYLKAKNEGGKINVYDGSGLNDDSDYESLFSNLKELDRNRNAVAHRLSIKEIKIGGETVSIDKNFDKIKEKYVELSKKMYEFSRRCLSQIYLGDETIQSSNEVV